MSNGPTKHRRAVGIGVDVGLNVDLRHPWEPILVCHAKTKTIGKSKAYSKTVSTSLYTARSHLFWAGMFGFLGVCSKDDTGSTGTLSYVLVGRRRLRSTTSWNCDASCTEQCAERLDFDCHSQGVVAFMPLCKLWPQLCTVHLRNAGRSNGSLLEFREHLAQALAQLRLNNSPDFFELKSRGLVMQSLQLGFVFLRQNNVLSRKMRVAWHC